MHPIKLAALSAAAGLAGLTAANAATLDDIKARGVLNCGINTGLVGFAFTDAQGNWQGFDVALCKAVAAAIFGDPSKVEYKSLTGATRFTALSAAEVDLLSRNTTWTAQRDSELKLDFQGVNYYDGQGFIVPKSLGVSSALELDGATVCVQTGTTTELNLADYFRVNNMEFTPVPIETEAEARERFLAGTCDAYTTDASGLAAARSAYPAPGDYLILPEIISKEPLGPVTRHGDSEWSDIVRWTLNALIIAEEKGITQENVADMAASPGDAPEVNRLLGTEGAYGAMLGLPADWAVQAISAGGNYGEIFDEYLGPDTPIGLERGLNALYTNGGLLYSPPFR
jgi:general L-amino acid transport system substrate-binding protein